MLYPRSAKVITSIVIAAAISIVACKKSTDITTDNSAWSQVLNIPDQPFNYASITLPAYLSTPNIAGQVNTPANNPVTDWGATLGRVIFYDKNVSVNKSISCASCHKQSNAFSDDLALSKGFNNGNTGRNSMALVNAKYYPNGRYFWDERAATLEIQTLTPIQDHVEMGMTLDTLVNRFKATTYYPALFTQAFGDNNITSDRISKALSQFVRSIVSFESKYDAGRGTLPANAPPPTFNFTNFTAQENRGMQLFFSPQLACAACHGTETFTAAVAKNNGLDLTTTDRGLGAVTNNTNDDGKFKVPSLRNIELTAPYMHDGRFTTLDQVVEHYNSGVKAHPNLDPVLKIPGGAVKQLNLNAADKAALVAFLKTLTDNKLQADVKYSNPFK
jgi:cytochrome c peroxidase